MTNVTVQETLRAAIEAMEYHTEQTRPIQKTIDTLAACKAALADIEKCETVAWQGLGICTLEKPAKNSHLFSPLYAHPERVESEPVAWMTKNIGVIEEFETMIITNEYKKSAVLAEKIIADLYNIPLYTSPISKELVELTDEQLICCYHSDPNSAFAQHCLCH